MSRHPADALILGGHTFIAQLGNDPPASEAEQRRIVGECFRCGIRRFDTTYRPERDALGRILEAEGKRKDAYVFAWNFFTTFSPGDTGLPPHEPYFDDHIRLILDELRTNRVDCLVLVPSGDEDDDARQSELLAGWQSEGLVKDLGLWARDPEIARRCANGPFRFAIRPFNDSGEGDASSFACLKSLGFETVATSPFGRGWELERVRDASAKGSWPFSGGNSSEVADLMLRRVTHDHGVDLVSVAMRAPRWVRSNIESVARGPLLPKERRRLQRWRKTATGELRGLRRFFR